MTNNSITESNTQFEQRKQDHITWALHSACQAEAITGFERIQLIHHALPDLNFSDITIEQQVFNQTVPTPFLISSMTAGHQQSTMINRTLAEAAHTMGWLMGVGSQRRELTDPQAGYEWRTIKKDFPRVQLLGNIGIAQVIEHTPAKIANILESLDPCALIVHTNPLQEALQLEGTPHFKGSLKALTTLCQTLTIPVILKETGCGFSPKTLDQLNDIGLYAVDISGLGGTHWGRIEGKRAINDPIRAQAAETFNNWGIDTIQSMLAARKISKINIWGSGGVRSGLDAAKLIALGAQIVGLAQPILEQALKGPQVLVDYMALLSYELKLAMFCTNCPNLRALQQEQIWQYNQK